MLQALGFFALIEAVGLAAAPLAGLLLARLPGSGLGFAKPLGMLLVGWLAWMAASLHVAPYGTGLILGAFVVVAAAGGLTWLRLRALARRLEERRPPRSAVGRWRRARLAARALPSRDPVRRRLFVGSEVVFAVAFVVLVVLVSYSPDVWNTEKPMDMAFVSAVDATDHFPPPDPWMSGESLNYYYLGHLILGMPGHVLGLEPSHGYNLAVAALFALTAGAVFTFAGTLWAAARVPARGGPVAAGLAAVALCVVLGNLAGVKAWLDAAHPPRDYDWFAPSRVIADTINEFPAFSFTLQDLHAHVLALPFSVLALGFALQVALVGPRGDVVGRAVAEPLAAGLAVGALYAINSWSYPVVAGLLVLSVLVWACTPRAAGRRAFGAAWAVLVLIASVVLTLPFWLNFNPAARGIGVVSHHQPFTRWLGDDALIYGVLVWPLLAAYASRVMTSRFPGRVMIWGGVGGLFALSLLAPVHLAGIAALAVALAAALHATVSDRLDTPECFLWLLVAGAVTCLLLPEVVYVRDAFDHTPSYRMNTVFKLGYQAYLLLAVAAACALPWAWHWLPRRAWPAWALVMAVLLLMGLVYPYAGTYARKDGFSQSPTLDGLGWLRQRAQGDLAAISWLRGHSPGDSVVLEAVGPDYSAFGHARISTFTGRSTVLGWAGHEIQWDHDPAGRENDVRQLYATTDVTQARALLSRYGVDYVVAGPIERTDYGLAGLAKWDRLGRRVVDVAGTTVWQLR